MAAITLTDESSQSRLFDPARYSPVTVAIWQRLPESNARAFAIGSALGSLLDGSGSSGRLRSGREAAGSLVKARRLPAVLQAIGISDRQWRRYVADWADRLVAHRCARGVVFLFAKPAFEDCPACHQWLEIHQPPPSWHLNRGAGFSSTDAQRPHERSRYDRTSGARTATAAAQERPRFERKSATPSGRSLLGEEVGLPLSPEEEEAFALAETLLKGSSEIAPRTRENEEEAG